MSISVFDLLPPNLEEGDEWGGLMGRENKKNKKQWKNNSSLTEMKSHSLQNTKMEGNLSLFSQRCPSWQMTHLTDCGLINARII